MKELILGFMLGPIVVAVFLLSVVLLITKRNKPCVKLKSGYGVPYRISDM